jgi:hypothetical protein
MRKGPGLQPLYHFDSPTGEMQIDQLYANDRARAEIRANTPNALPNMNEIPRPPRSRSYAGGARMNF